VSGTDPVWAAIATKRMIRAFADRPLAPDHLDRILAAGRRAGSSKNLQRWSFIVCRDRERLVALSRVGPFAGHLAGAAVGAKNDPPARGRRSRRRAWRSLARVRRWRCRRPRGYGSC